MKTLRYVRTEMMRMIFTERMLTFTLLMLIICRIYNEPVRRFAIEMKHSCAPWVFPYLVSQYMFLLLFFLAVIYVNADIPFLQYQNMYCLIRAGRKKWAMVKIVVLFFRSFFLTGITCLCAGITLFPQIEWTTGWGTLMKNAAMGRMPEDIYLKYFFFYESMIKKQPVELMCEAILITGLVVFLLSLLLFTVSLFANRIAAVSAAVLEVLLMFFTLNTHPKIRYRIALFVPAIWPEVARMDTPDVGYYWLPSFGYMLAVLAAGIILFCMLCIYKIDRAEFDWRNEER